MMRAHRVNGKVNRARFEYITDTKIIGTIYKLFRKRKYGD